MDCGGLAVTVSAVEQESFTECIFIQFSYYLHMLCIVFVN